MKLYMISQTKNNNYDTFDSAVVSAPDAETARTMHPESQFQYFECLNTHSTWCLPEDVDVMYLGETDLEQQIICASFNAG
jgi:hypothetical protein